MVSKAIIASILLTPICGGPHEMVVTICRIQDWVATYC